MELLNSYFKLQEEIYDYFGYKEDWVCIPLQDRTDMYWELEETGGGGGCVRYCDEPLTADIL